MLGALLLGACGGGAVGPAGSTSTGGASGGEIRAIDRPAMVERVRGMLRSAWAAYAREAWGHDELLPVSHKPKDWYGSSLLITPVDALDSLIMLGLTDEANAARQLIDTKLNFDQDLSVQNFEITIRVLGGLLSGYQLTSDAALLRLADDLGTRLLPVFGSPTGMPYTHVNLKTGAVSGPKSNPAEIGTLILEFGTLSKLTGKPVFYDKAKAGMVALYARRSPIGLFGDQIDVETGQWTSTESHVGAGIDSYYEYLLKGSLLFGDAELGAMWRATLPAIHRYEADEVSGSLWYAVVDMASGQRREREFGALEAFFPGLLALGGDIERARRLEDSCFRMWQLRGIEPEVIDYATMKITEPMYPLRPEIIESAWYLRRITGDPRYLAMGRTFLESLDAHARVGDAFTVMHSVETMTQGDLMPSYFLAESLKYLYLMFAPDDAVDLSKVVFNTEAHPLRRTW